MLSEFIDFTESILPNVSPDVADKAKAAIEQFEKKGEVLNYLMDKPLDDLSQGDILSKLPFFFCDKNGEQFKFTADAFVVSTSCDIDNKDRIILAPVLSLAKFSNGNKNSIDELKRNIIYNTMYLPDLQYLPYFQGDDKYVDFSYLSSYNKDLVCDGISSGRIQHLSSLSQVGYYFFIVKLTVFFMRKEDSTTQAKRKASL